MVSCLASKLSIAISPNTRDADTYNLGVGGYVPQNAHYRVHRHRPSDLSHLSLGSFPSWLRWNSS